MDNGRPSLISLKKKLVLANETIIRLQQKLTLVQSIADATSSQINIITNSQKRYHTVHDEYESRIRSFESSYWLSVFDISERSHRGFDDPSAVLTTEELLILETDRHHFLESLSTIAPDLHDFYSSRSYHSSPW